LEQTFEDFSEILQLLQVPSEIPFGFFERITADLLEKTASQNDGYHGFAHNAGRWNNSRIRPVVGSIERFLAQDINRSEGLSQRRNRFDVSSDDNVTPIGRASFYSACVIGTSKECPLFS